MSAAKSGPLDQGGRVELVTLGECLVSLVAADLGPLSEAATFHRYIAGSEANVAVGLARLGHPVAYLGCVGDDGFGTAIVRRLRGEGVDVTRLRVAAGARTGTMFRERRGAGPSEVVYHRAGSAGSKLGPEDISAAVEAGLFRGARRLHVSGITPALSVTCRAAVTEAIEAAQAAGLPISLDLNLRRRLWSDRESSTVLGGLVPHCDIVFGSLDEAAVVAGMATDADAPAVAAALIGLGARRVVLKLGPDGAASLGPDGGWVSAPAVAGISAVDPVGAGDAFCAGYLAATLEGLDEAAALVLGNACGAAVVAAEGDFTGAPSRAEADLLVRMTAHGSEQSVR